MSVEMSAEERELVAELLDQELEDVRSEQHHTQAFDYKESLRRREVLIRGLLAKLAA